MENDKQRLVELLEEANREAWDLITMSCCEERLKLLDKANELRADYLLANGVIVPPYKVGTRVYVVVSRTSNNKNLYIVEDVITHYRIFDDCMIMCFVEHLGLPDYKWGNVFLTKKEAEQALNNIQNGNCCEGGKE